MRVTGSLAVVLVAIVALAFPPGRAAADGAWLDDPSGVAQWNVPGAEIPVAPLLDPGTQGRCIATQRPAETEEDLLLSVRGWMPIGAYHAGWGIKIILAASGYDGMCRPLGYQMFVFEFGRFAGTVSPVLMDSRSDGAAIEAALFGPDNIIVHFNRYADIDPLCCPSARSTVNYAVTGTENGPVLLVTGYATSPNEP